MTRDGTVGRSDATEPNLAFHRDIDPVRMSQQATYALQQTAMLVDHLVSQLLQVERNVEAEHSGSVEIDDELELRGLLDRQVGRPLTLENPRGVDADLAIAVDNAGAVSHQPAGGSELTQHTGLIPMNPIPARTVPSTE